MEIRWDCTNKVKLVLLVLALGIELRCGEIRWNFAAKGLLILTPAQTRTRTVTLTALGHLGRDQRVPALRD